MGTGIFLGPWLSSALLGALIGWITNVMTIRLIFRPRRPIGIGGWTLQGIVPRRRPELARSLARTIASELLSATELWRRIDTAPHREALLNGVRSLVRERLRRLPAFPFRAAVAERIEDTVVRELDEYLERLARDPDLPARLLAHVPVADLIEERINQLDLDEFERIIVGLSRRELRQAELLGGVLGFAVGLVLPLVDAVAH